MSLLSEDFASTLTIVRSLISVSLAVSCLENLARIKNYHSTGIFSWKVFQTQFPKSNWPLVNDLSSAVFSFHGTWTLYFVQLLCAALMLIPGFSAAFYLFPVGLALLIRLALSYRCAYGSEGADQMETIVLAGLFACGLLRNTGNADLGIWFIALQSALSYAVSGISKLLSRSWMSGDAASKIFNTYTYGMGPVASVFSHSSGLSMIACWSVVGFECAFPISLFSSVAVLAIFVIGGILFHLFNAAVMGLNRFFWVFVSTYPAVIYCHGRIAALVRF